jgi:hypothetical protein
LRLIIAPRISTAFAFAKKFGTFGTSPFAYGVPLEFHQSTHQNIITVGQVLSTAVSIISLSCIYSEQVEFFLKCWEPN